MTTPISLAASLFLAVASPAPAQQPIESHNPFEREMGRGLALDQEHLGTDVIGGSLSCQVFTPLAGRLERLDIVTKNRTDPSPGDIRLWEWHGSYETTVAGEPVWEDSLQFSGQDSPYVRHYFPRVDVEPGEQYMIECSRPSEGFYVAGSQTDEYADGFMIAGGRERPDWDMWFRTFGPGEDEALQPLALPEMPDVTPTLPRPPAEVTRDVYLDTVSTYVERTYEHWESERGRRASELMYYCGFLYRFADDARWSERVSLWLADAKTYLDENETFGGSPWYVDQMGLGILWLRGCEHWDDGVEALARDVMLAATRRLMETPERGAMNRTVWDVHGARLASDLFPNSPEAAEWRAYSDEAWRDWADFDDTEEDSSHYNAVFLHFMLAHLHVTDRQDIFKRPGMRALVDRWRETIPPAGMMVGWGDSVGMGADWGAWVAAFETASTATGDGTYKWAAHRLLDGHRRRYLDDDPLQQGYEDMRSVPLAYIGADDSITPVEPAPKSGIHTTTYPRLNPPALRRDQGMPHFSLEDRQTPWKLVMRDGIGDDAYFSLFGLLPGAGHGHNDAPALLGLGANGTVFTEDTAYFHKGWSDHSILFGVHVSGGELGDQPTETEATLQDGDLATFARVIWSDYAGWGMQFERDILFVKGLGWWIRDRTVAKEPQTWFLGPLWHVDRIRERGETWFDVDYPRPMSFAWPTANGSDHLLVHFSPKPGATIDYSDYAHRVDPDKPWYSSVPYAAYQCAGPIDIGPDAPATFDTLLIPLPADESAADAAAGIAVSGDGSEIKLTRGPVTWTITIDRQSIAVARAGGDEIATKDEFRWD